MVIANFRFLQDDVIAGHNPPSENALVNPTSSAPGVSVSALFYGSTDGGAIQNTSQNGTTGFTEPGFLIGRRNRLNDDFAQMFFTITNNTAEPLELVSFSFEVGSHSASRTVTNITTYFDSAENLSRQSVTGWASVNHGNVNTLSASYISFDLSGFAPIAVGETIQLGLGYGVSNSLMDVNFANFSVTAIPEPSTYVAICGLVILGLVAWRRRQR